MSVFDPIATPPVDLGPDGWRYTARVVKWSDGDTVVVDCLVDVGFEEMTTKRRRIRLLGVDTPEKNSPDPATRVEAKRAWAYSELTAPPGTPLEVIVVKFDKYGGRDDGTVALLENGLDLSQALIQGGYGVPYSGGAR